MIKDYWKEFYKDNQITNEPSTFAKFIAKYTKNHDIRGKLIDLGCGNGRDTYYLQESFSTWGIDEQAPNEKGFIKNNVMKQLRFISSFDVVYSRFFLHTLTNNNIRKIIQHTTNYFIAETRAVGDIPIIYSNHKRYFTNPGWLIKTLLKENFDILYFEKDYDLAKYKEENPLIIRVIAKRK